MGAVALVKSVPRERIVDRYGELDEEIRRFAPTLTEHRQLREEIEGWYASHPAGQPAVAKGKVYSIQLTACKRERTLTDPRKAFSLLQRALGSLDAVIAVITIPLTTAIDKYLPASQHKQFLTAALTGSRTLSVVRNERERKQLKEGA